MEVNTSGCLGGDSCHSGHTCLYLPVGCGRMLGRKTKDKTSRHAVIKKNFKCGATKQKQSLGCMQFTVKVCNMSEELSEQVAQFHSKLRTSK